VRILLIIHQRDAGAGVFADAVTETGHELIEWHASEASAPALESLGAAIVFGGSAQVDEEHVYPWLAPEKELLRNLLAADTPLLGVCLGSQLLAEVAGAPVRRAAEPEIGWVEVSLTPDGAADPLMSVLPERFGAFQWHHYEWLLPPRAAALARSHACLQAFRLADHPAWGVQFHPEVTTAILGGWLDGWANDPGAVATGLDPEAIRAQSVELIGPWNELGRTLADRFLALAAGNGVG
jgi:GMP synthase-like glutamine amidotransferase